MKLKLVLSFVFFAFFSSLNAQIMYKDEEIKKKYDQETMVLTLDGTEKNGVLSRFNYLFPSQEMQEEINKNGGPEAQRTYKEYKKTITLYWVISILGIVAIVASGLFLLSPAIIGGTTGTIQSAFLIYMLIAIGVSIGIAFLGKKAFRQLAMSIWQYNRHVLLRK